MAGHRLTAIGAVLVTYRCFETDAALAALAVRQKQFQRAVAVEADLFGASESQRNLPHVSTGRNQEVVFQLVLVAVIAHVNAFVDAAVTHCGIVGYVLQPLLGGAEEVVRARGHFALSQRWRIVNCALEQHLHGGWGSGPLQHQRGAAGLKTQVVATAAGDEVNASRRLATVDFEVERQTTQLQGRSGLWHRGCCAGRDHGGVHHDTGQGCQI